MATEETARAHLSQLMEDRRLDLRMTWDEVATAVGISVAHLRRIRSGAAPLTPKVVRGIEDSLQWSRGSIETVLHGGDLSDAASRDVTSNTGTGAPAVTKTEPSRHFETINGGKNLEDYTEAQFDTDLEAGRTPPGPPGGFRNEAEQKMWAITVLTPAERWAAIRGLRQAKADAARLGAQQHAADRRNAR